MVRIPGGTLCNDCVGRVREGTEYVPSFEIDVTEVTVRAYAACVRAGACTPAVSPASTGTFPQGVESSTLQSVTATTVCRPLVAMP